MTTITASPTLDSVFSWADALTAGMTRNETHSQGQRVMRGIYTSEPTVLRSRISAALFAAGPQAAICGSTALAWAGVDLPARLVRDTRVWIQVPTHQHWPVRSQVRLIRPRKPARVAQVDGVPCADLPYCWLHLASESNVDELVEIADSMMRRQHPITTLEALAATTATHPRTRGLLRARDALRLAVPGTDSIPETDLRLLLVRSCLPRPSVNFPIHDDAGRVLFRLDLADEESKTAIEYDGAHHVGDRPQMERDAARRRYLEDQGWRIITVTSADLVKDPMGVVQSVHQALNRRFRS